MRRALAALALLAVLAVAGYWFLIRDKPVEARLQPLALAATIGPEGERVTVNADGEVLRWLREPEGIRLPSLPGDEIPKAKRLKGPMLEQARVLGAVPPALRRYVASSSYGETGVDVELTSGIELRFGDASQAERKWRAAATVLADPELTALDYVDLSAPNRPSTGGEGHPLPELP